ncbi:MAG: NUDIX domain-containing protein [Dehalococcoidales bacterium]|nr:NUDIX domain-containing protein [Dehalococcoidales bacterium]
MDQQPSMARDGEEYYFHNNGQDWIVSWHPPVLPPPAGTPHGSAAICFTHDRDVILISQDGEYWDLPGGRPDGDEDWRTTLDREMLEETCAQVEDAMLLGFSKGVCVSGHEEGLTLIRALWSATVSLLPWEPRYEISHRLLLPADTALDKLLTQTIPFRGIPSIYRRWFHEAMNAG